MRFIGEISALAAATIWAATSMLITYVAAKIGSLYANIGRMSLSLIFFIGVILIFRLPIELSARQWLFLALSALIGIVFGDTFLFKAFQQIGARLSMLIMASAPAIAALLAYVFLRETLTATGMLGMLVTMIGIAFVVLERSDARSAASPVTLSGLIYAFARSMTTISAVIFLTTPETKIMTQQIYAETDAGRFGNAFAYIVLLIGIVLVVIGMLQGLIGLATGAERRVKTE